MNSRPVGHVLHFSDADRAGYNGIAYDYVLAGNGLFVEAENAMLRARVRCQALTVRGLGPLEPSLEIKQPPAPGLGFQLLSGLLTASVERYGALARRAGAYEVVWPPQEQGPAHVSYTRPQEPLLLEIHSHPGMGAFFSGTDTADEQGFGLYAVLGLARVKGRNVSAVTLRLGVYGYFMPVRWRDVFGEPLLDGVIVDLAEVEQANDQEEAYDVVGQEV